MYDDSGRQVGIQGCERDITQRKLAEESLRKSEHRFRELLERIQLVAVMTGARRHDRLLQRLHALALPDGRGRT